MENFLKVDFAIRKKDFHSFSFNVIVTKTEFIYRRKREREREKKEQIEKMIKRSEKSILTHHCSDDVKTFF
mgnify:CR=1 FL=1